MIPVTVRIFVCTEPVDMRRGFDGLALIARQKLEQDPRSGALLIFSNRRRKRVTLCILPSSKRQLERLPVAILLGCPWTASFDFLHALTNGVGRKRFDRDLPRCTCNCLSSWQLPFPNEFHDGARADRQPSRRFVSRNCAARILFGIIRWYFEPLTQLPDTKFGPREAVWRFAACSIERDCDLPIVPPFS